MKFSINTIPFGINSSIEKMLCISKYNLLFISLKINYGIKFHYNCTINTNIYIKELLEILSLIIKKIFNKNFENIQLIIYIRFLGEYRYNMQ